MDELVDTRALWDFEDPSGSEIRFRAAAEGAPEPVAAVWTTQVARALGLQERYDEGHAALDGVDPALSGHPAVAEVGVRVHLERGRLIRSAGRSEESREHFTRAALEAETAGLAGLQVDALHMLALLEPTPETQAEANRAALEVASRSPDPQAQRWKASLLNNLGCALVDAGDPESALPVFRDALAECEARKEPRETQIARWMVGWTLRLLGRIDEALVLQRALKEELDSAGIEDPYVDEELQILESGSPNGISPLDP